MNAVIETIQTTAAVIPVSIPVAIHQVAAWTEQPVRRAVVLAALEVADELDYAAAYEWFEDAQVAADYLAESAEWFKGAAMLASIDARGFYAWCEKNAEFVAGALANLN